MLSVPFSRIPGMISPVIPPPKAADLLALQFQLAQSERWPAQVVSEAQQVQLSVLLTHAAQQIPFYRERLAQTGWQPNAMISMQQFRRLPLLQRSEAMQLGESLRAESLPAERGEVSSGFTSGSTGKALKFWSCEAQRTLQMALNLRLYLWYGWDLRQSIGGIRVDRDRVAEPPDGKTFNNWGAGLAGVIPTGPYHMMSARADVQKQLDWLQKRRPAYLQTHPNILRELFMRAQETRQDLSWLQGVSTLGEVVSEELRDLVLAVAGQELADVYSSQELGYLAIQCARHRHYHVQSENVLLEVLDEQGQPCAPGQTGRVVVTSLHNFAAPLIRYEIGDFAEVGEACDCGCQLPTLTRIMGRSRNMLHKPNGETAWPHFGTAAMHRAAPIRQFQVVQTALDQIELRLVLDEPLNDAVEKQLKAILCESLEYPFEVSIKQVEAIERGANGKFEDFMSCL